MASPASSATRPAINWGVSPRPCATWPATTPSANCKAARKFQAPSRRRLKAKARGAPVASRDLENKGRDYNEPTEAIGAGCPQCLLFFVIVEGNRAERLRLPDQMPGCMRPRPLRRGLPLRRQARHVAVHGGAATRSLQTGDDDDAIDREVDGLGEPVANKLERARQPVGLATARSHLRLESRAVRRPLQSAQLGQRVQTPL